MSVTVVSCIYGDAYDEFVPRWDKAINALDPRADDVIVMTDRQREILHAHVFVVPSCPWLHPQAFYLNKAIGRALTDWVWIVDIDDVALPDALVGLDDVDADVWISGYLRDSYLYLVVAEPDIAERNPIPAGSFVRVEAFKRAGGFPDVAFQDWALWKRMQASGATFEASDRAHYRYSLGGRTTNELLPEYRQTHVAEMLAHV